MKNICFLLIQHIKRKKHNNKFLSPINHEILFLITSSLISNSTLEILLENDVFKLPNYLDIEYYEVLTHLC